MPNRFDVERAVLDSDLPKLARLLALVLLTHADNETAEIPARFTPSLSTLARESGVDRSTVQRVLTRMESAGWLTRTRPPVEQSRKGVRTRYRLAVPVDEVGAQRTQGVGAVCTCLGAGHTQPGSTAHLGVGAGSRKPRCTVHPNHSCSDSTPSTPQPPTNSDIGETETTPPSAEPSPEQQLADATPRERAERTVADACPDASEEEIRALVDALEREATTSLAGFARTLAERGALAARLAAARAKKPRAKLPPPCGRCDARPGDPPSARIEWLDGSRTEARQCPRCHPSSQPKEVTTDAA